MELLSSNGILVWQIHVQCPRAMNAFLNYLNHLHRSTSVLQRATMCKTRTYQIIGILERTRMCNFIIHQTL